MTVRQGLHWLLEIKDRNGTDICAPFFVDDICIHYDYHQNALYDFIGNVIPVSLIRTGNLTAVIAGTHDELAPLMTTTTPQSHNLVVKQRSDATSFNQFNNAFIRSMTINEWLLEPDITFLEVQWAFSNSEAVLTLPSELLRENPPPPWEEGDWSNFTNRGGEDQKVDWLRFGF